MVNKAVYPDMNFNQGAVGTSFTPIGSAVDGESEKFFQDSLVIAYEHPITIRNNRIHISEKDMDVDRVYSIPYGKVKLIMRKASDGKIHVHTAQALSSVLGAISSSVTNYFLKIK